MSTVKTVRRQDPARTLSGLCQDCQDSCGSSTNQVMPMPTPLTRASPNRAVPLLSTVMLLAIIVTTTCQLRTGVARDMRT